MLTWFFARDRASAVEVHLAVLHADLHSMRTDLLETRLNLELSAARTRADELEFRLRMAQTHHDVLQHIQQQNVQRLETVVTTQREQIAQLQQQHAEKLDLIVHLKQTLFRRRYDAICAAEREALQAAERSKAASRAETDDDDTTLCKICLEKPLTHAFVPCYHFCVCETRASCNKCPICQADIVDRLRIFQS